MKDALLIALSIKGFAKIDILTSCLGADSAALSDTLKYLETGDYMTETKLGFKLTPAGQTVAAEAVANERQNFEPAKMDDYYNQFCNLNGPFKSLMVDWQMRTVDGEQVYNDHSDDDHDGRVIARLDDINTGLETLLDELAKLAPRLNNYKVRFVTALAEIQKGNHRFVAAPIIDSYHTVWFELHEDLIRLSGKTRAEEAKAGRAH